MMGASFALHRRHLTRKARGLIVSLRPLSTPAQSSAPPPLRDLKAMEQAFAKIDERAFQLLLNLDHFHPVQVVIIEAMERHAPGVPIDSRDPGSMFGRF